MIAVATALGDHREFIQQDEAFSKSKKLQTATRRNCDVLRAMLVTRADTTVPGASIGDRRTAEPFSGLNFLHEKD